MIEAIAKHNKVELAMNKMQRVDNLYQAVDTSQQIAGTPTRLPAGARRHAADSAVVAAAPLRPRKVCPVPCIECGRRHPAPSCDRCSCALRQARHLQLERLGERGSVAPCHCIPTTETLRGA